jgi:hypothetical protein
MYQNYQGQFQELNQRQTKLYDFTVGDLQWDKDVREQLIAENRPANSYNLIRTIINVMFSVERDNRKKGVASPRTTGDNELASIINKTLDYFLYRGGFDEAAKRVFMDTIIARFGVYHIGWKYNGTEDDRGSLFVNSVDPREMIYEPNFNDPLWSDSSFLFRKHKMNIDEIINTFSLNDDEMELELMKEVSLFYESEQKRDKWISKRLKALFSAVYETATSYSSGTSDNVYKNYSQWFDITTGKFDILELHEKRTERRLIINDQTQGKVIDLTDIYQKEHQNLLADRKFDGFRFDKSVIGEIKNKYGLTGTPTADLMPRRFQTIVIPAFNMKIAEKAYPVDTQNYVYIPQYCYDYHADPLKTQSVMDDLIDPQADFNKSKSLILELLGRYANKGWIMDENAIDGLEEDWETNSIAPYRRVRAGYINMIKPEQGQTISPELVRMPMELQGLMKTISNADDEVRGNASPGVTSGKHFLAKEQRQAKSYTYILENRDRSQRAVFQTALDFIQHFATTQQIIRVVENDSFGKETITINQSQIGVDETGRIVETIINDIDAEKYDIEITQEPYSSSAQEERYAKLGELFNATAQLNPQKADALLDIMVKAGNFPNGEEIITAWEQATNPQPSPEQQQQEQIANQLQMIMAQLGIEKEKAEIQKTHAETKRALSDASRNSFEQNHTVKNILGALEENAKKEKQEKDRKERLKV